MTSIEERPEPGFIEGAGIDTDALNRPFWQEHLRTIATLGTLSAVSFLSERLGFIHLLPEVLQPIANSTAHPAVGYAAALLVDASIEHNPSGESLPLTTLAIAATVGDMATETVQSLLYDDAGHKMSFLAKANVPETLKDYGFTMLGFLFYIYQSRRHKNKQTEPAEQTSQ